MNGVWVVREVLDESHKPVNYEARMGISLVPDIADKLDIVLGDILDIPSVI